MHCARHEPKHLHNICSGRAHSGLRWATEAIDMDHREGMDCRYPRRIRHPSRPYFARFLAVPAMGYIGPEETWGILMVGDNVVKIFQGQRPGVSWKIQSVQGSGQTACRGETPCWSTSTPIRSSSSCDLCFGFDEYVHKG